MGNNTIVRCVYLCIRRESWADRLATEEDEGPLSSRRGRGARVEGVWRVESVRALGRGPDFPPHPEKRVWLNSLPLATANHSSGEDLLLG